MFGSLHFLKAFVYLELRGNLNQITKVFEIQSSLPKYLSGHSAVSFENVLHKQSGQDLKIVGESVSPS